MPEIIKIGYFLTGVIQKAFWDTVHIELWLILSSICVKKIHQFLSSINKDARKRKLVSFFPYGVVSISLLHKILNACQN